MVIQVHCDEYMLNVFTVPGVVSDFTGQPKFASIVLTWNAPCRGAIQIVEVFELGESPELRQKHSFILTKSKSATSQIKGTDTCIHMTVQIIQVQEQETMTKQETMTR